MYRYLAKKVTENYLPNQAIVKQLANSQFTARYFDYERMKLIDYKCDSSVDEIDIQIDK
jgi:hypothetical protein